MLCKNPTSEEHVSTSTEHTYSVKTTNSNLGLTESADKRPAKRQKKEALDAI